MCILAAVADRWVTAKRERQTRMKKLTKQEDKARRAAAARRRRLFVWAMPMLALAAAATWWALRDDGRLRVRIGSTEFTLEVAATDEARQQGLMGRTALGEAEGMIFVYPDSRMRNFWMKNTPLPLSIAYMDEYGVINEIQDLEPLTETPVPSARPARYAIELNRGAFARAGAKPGDKVVSRQRIRWHDVLF